MKKWIAFLLILVLGLALYGCDDPDNNGEDKVNITGVVIEGNPTQMEVGETKQLTARVEPENAPQEVVWSSKNEEIATVDETGLVTAVGEGLAEIVATSKSNNRHSRTVTIQVVKPIVYDDPTGVEISTSVLEFEVGSRINLKATVFPNEPNEETGTAGARQDVLWESSDENIATVEANGRVTGVAVGEVTITVKVVANPELTDSITLLVKEPTEGDLPDQPTGIIVFGDTEVEEGVKVTLNAIVLPSGISQNVVWSSEDPQIATVDDRGIVTTLAPGKARIKVASTLDLNVFRIYEIDVKPAVVLPDRKDLQGYTIKIMAAGHALNEHDPKLDDYIGNDRTAKLAAWEEVEALYNATLEVVPFPENAPWGQPRIDYLIAQANIGQAETDIFVSTTDWLDQLAGANAVVDVSEYYAKYGKNSMSPYVRSASSYRGKLYAMTTGNAGGGIIPYHGLFYNVNMLEELDLDNPAKLFNEGKWTWTKFDEYMREVASVLDEGKSVIAGQPSGLFYGMVSAAGVALVDPTNMRLNFNHPYATQAARLLRDLYAIENMAGTIAWDQNMTSFNEGDSLFAIAEYWFVKTDNRFPADMWGENTRFGYVPFPHPDKVDKSETRVSYQGGAIYQMQAGREHAYPAGVTSEDIYRAFTDLFLITSDKILSDPEYDEEVLARRAAASRLDDPESITAITFFKGNQVIWDPFYSILPSWSHAGPMINRIVVNAEDYNSVMSEFAPVFQSRMQDLYGAQG